jgi:hypothetical protein
VIEPDLFSSPVFKLSTLSPTKSPMLSFAFIPILIVPLTSVVSVPIVAPVVFIFPIVSTSLTFTGKVGTPANTPTASSTLLIS